MAKPSMRTQRRTMQRKMLGLKYRMNTWGSGERGRWAARGWIPPAGGDSKTPETGKPPAFLARPAAALPPWLYSIRRSSCGRERGFGQGLVPAASRRKGIWFPEKVYTAADGGYASKINN